MFLVKGRRVAGAGWRGLGDLGDGVGAAAITTGDAERAVRALNQAARSQYLSGQPIEIALGTFGQAQALAQTYGLTADFSDDFAQTQALLSGDQGAAQAQAQNDARLVTGKVNAKPDSVAGAFVGSLGQSAKDTVKTIANNVQSAGNPFGISLQTAGLYAAGIGVGLVALNAFFSSPRR